MPAAEADQTLSRLLLVEALVIAARAARCSAAVAWAIVRVGLLPLDRMGRTAARIAGGDLVQRVERRRPAHRDRAGWGSRSTGCSTGSRRPSREREASERAPAPVPRRRLARAAHPARLDARLRGAVPHRRRARAGRGREGDAADRGGVARGWACWSTTCSRSRASTRSRDRRTRTSTSPRSRATRSTTRAPTAPDRAITLAADRPASIVRGDADQLRQVLANLLRNALVHTPAGTPIEVGVARDGGEVALEVRDHGPGLPTATRTRCSSASGAPRAGASAAGGRRPRPRDRRRDRRGARRPRERRERARRRRVVRRQLPAAR